MERLELAKQLAQEAGEIVLGYAKKGFRTSQKDGGSLVTEADLAAEKHILAKIKEYFPDDGIVAEEMGAQEGKSDFSWHIDPLDGTTNFAHGLPLYGVSIGITKGVIPYAGAIFLPPFGELYEAERGRGARLNGSLLSVSGTEETSSGIIALAGPRFVDSVRDDELPLQKIISRIRRIRVLGSIVMNLCLVAKGAADGGLCVRQNSWDAVAGVSLVEEAGGIAVDFLGEPYTTKSENLLVGNPKVVSFLQKLV
ncbi:MAG: hypothetical protein A2806_02180 [Candidatus Terrybacteria bacterium RIFCSPHIGHO2_01_FULL_48_17]|uniref:Inositol-1-monophosphatase n=1 Tax=Candidatus Terrybacteria bacterium RIFCSPHIGHO2_01_FULL_48_17 TaxID=1802362 RepID=A0A1G2PJK9_9BACT|nr:MAG: hypothetical protein A2806_02180 [Candidatus Terrybacteria bacterium RIFCSPHIGHO2_01_FULL_48_17]OHA53557.1 MAG: hypothetical protein A3A30_00135 [Candidatus Terrybacteria bacterium RIFCSPLOWO2_01_FULL_48_14]